MLNKVILIGRLTRDPEIRVTPSETKVAMFTLAVERDFARQGEERQTDFINLVMFGKTAEFAEKYVVKGQLIAAEGRIQTRSWDDKNGNKRIAVEVLAEHLYFAEAKRDTYGAPAAPQTQAAPAAPAPAYGAAPSEPQSDFAPLFDDDDNLPF